MDDQAFGNLDFARYLRWLHRIAGVNYPAAVCTPEGVPLWSDDNCKAAWLDALTKRGFDWSCIGNGMQHHALDSGKTVLYIPVHSHADALLGYLALLADDADAPSWDTLAEAAEDVVAAIADEHMLKSELNVMARELSERYEELHLVYAIDQKLRSAKDGESIFYSLLKSCAEHMNVDIAAFVKPNENFCVSATNLSKPLHNLDLEPIRKLY